jgi:hypothetical protein
VILLTQVVEILKIMSSQKWTQEETMLWAIVSLLLTLWLLGLRMPVSS